MSHALAMLIESLVAVLLMLTIGYCVVLNRRLKGLKTDERAMHQMIAELLEATDKAERSIAGLKLTVAESDQTLGERIRSAERLSGLLERQIGAAEQLLAISAPGGSGAGANRGSEPAPPPDAKAVVAAANAFAERARARMLGHAA